jgi:pyrroline-5-carboxylate reductase
MENNTALAGGADVIVLSVKPQNMEEVLNEIKGTLKESVLVISIAAGVTTAKIAGANLWPLRLSSSVPLVRQS